MVLNGFSLDYIFGILLVGLGVWIIYESREYSKKILKIDEMFGRKRSKKEKDLWKFLERTEIIIIGLLSIFLGIGMLVPLFYK